eukprot:GFKZ01002184.1.p1 GENE.GFKZ01002184.1~~GFKZ01002184.1.p1  ORF type:complete len:279 (+),score=28.71 GFKZ01002184.1:60-839(+)
MAIPDMEKTNNRMGFMFNKIGTSFDYWFSSLPSSSKPLLDLGAAYGVHTLHALRHGRDVIAVDCDESHLSELQERAKLLLDHERTEGRVQGALVRTLHGRLPCKEILGEGSVSGVLLSEVVHFIRPAEVQEVFDDVFSWLEPGGLFVVTAVGITRLRNAVERSGFTVRSGRTVSETLAFIEQGSDDEVLEGAPGFVISPQEYKWSHITPGWCYFLSTREVSLYAKRAGFHIERLDYINADKYPTGIAENSTVLLVAKKL